MLLQLLGLRECRQEQLESSAMSKEAVHCGMCPDAMLAVGYWQKHISGTTDRSDLLDLEALFKPDLRGCGPEDAAWT